jgi:hypothetical protein
VLLERKRPKPEIQNKQQSEGNEAEHG